ncbi:hypothetical protein AVEN_135467-1 [Araneus ventricosus]|uniref:Uncharacterized protein n=1 Tax=Araneus ventricosus TaxID=182803 RepID=A0A4Y2BG45_ARAVE|nr:hypothetical protein AVEN_135467-1 [Araneus ventricosus]
MIIALAELLKENSSIFNEWKEMFLPFEFLERIEHLATAQPDIALAFKSFRKTIAFGSEKVFSQSLVYEPEENQKPFSNQATSSALKQTRNIHNKTKFSAF